MNADLKPYPAMKDSGVEWLGEVSEHWEVLRFSCAGALVTSCFPSHSRAHRGGTRGW